MYEPDVLQSVLSIGLWLAYGLPCPEEHLQALMLPKASGVRTARDRILAVKLPSCVTLGKLLGLSGL